MNTDFSKNHFALFGLQVAFDLDVHALDQTWRELQREVHPDRFANASDAEQRLAAQWATRVNEAHRTLKSPIDRARYLLHLEGVDTGEETDTQMPVDFLMQQMEWREAVEAARATGDQNRLDALASGERNARRALVEALRAQLGDARAFADARVTVRKLRFIDKLAEEIDLAHEDLEA
jgi:molecular chaperone HscB